MLGCVKLSRTWCKVKGRRKNCNTTSPRLIDSLNQSSKSLTSITIGFSLLPSTRSLKNSSHKKSQHHCCCWASVTVGEVWIGIKSVRDCHWGGGIVLYFLLLPYSISFPLVIPLTQWLLIHDSYHLQTLLLIWLAYLSFIVPSYALTRYINQ